MFCKDITKIKQKADLGVMILIIVGILIVVNFFSYQIFYRWDLTQNNDYSISKVSKNAVSKLDDIVNIKVYFSKNLPSQYISLPQEVGDILDEYAEYSDNKIKVKFIDPTEDEDMARELMMMGIPELQFNVIEKDKLQVVRGYLGMAIQYGDKNEVIPVVQGTKNLEYQMTLAIKKVTSEEMSVVGFVTNNATADLDSEMSVAYKALQELYQVQRVDLETVEEVPLNISALIIAGPKQEFNENQLKMIDDFVMKGGSLLVLADGVKIEDGLMAVSNDIGINSLLENYGVKLNHNLVLDVSSGMASFTQGFITFSTNYPFWPKIIKDGFDEDNAAVAGLESLLLPWVSSLDILTDNIDSNNKISYLAQTTNKSWLQTENFNLNPQQAFIPSSETKKRVLAVSITGKFNSAYSDNSIDSGSLIVVGDSDFVKDNFIRNNPNNLIFFQNLVDSLSLDEDLISIRSKGISDRPIKELSDSQKAAIRYLNVFGLTIAVVALGMVRYYIRRKSKFVDEL